jgi:PTH1 family peptidyl-tRNA hydrolase
VVGYVLKSASRDERVIIDRAIDEAVKVLPEIISGNFDKAMKELHTAK